MLWQALDHSYPSVFARSIAQRHRQLRINPSLTLDQLLGTAPADDLEKVLAGRQGRVHFVQVGNDEQVSSITP